MTKMLGVLAAIVVLGCCPRPGHRGLTPDHCALVSEAACRQQCAELPTGATDAGPIGQEFAGFREGDFCACADPDDGAFRGSAVGGPRSDIEAAWKNWRAHGEHRP